MDLETLLGSYDVVWKTKEPLNNEKYMIRVVHKGQKEDIMRNKGFPYPPSDRVYATGYGGIHFCGNISFAKFYERNYSKDDICIFACRVIESYVKICNVIDVRDIEDQNANIIIYNVQYDGKRDGIEIIVREGKEYFIP